MSEFITDEDWKEIKTKVNKRYENEIESLLHKINKDIKGEDMDLTIENWSRLNIKEGIKDFTHVEKVGLAAFCAEKVIGIFESKYPDDKRPRLAIEAAKEFIKNPTDESKQRCKQAADAADAAAYSADATAYAAAYAAAAYTNNDKVKQEIIDYIKELKGEKMTETTKQKAFKDAVKEFNGAWPTDTKNTNYWFAGSLSNMHYEIDGVLKHVCSKKEFEDYAKMMELNKLNKEAVKINIKEDAIRGEETVSYTMLKQLVSACENNTGNEPSLSCYHYALDKAKTFLGPRTDEEKLIDDMESLITEHCSSNGTLRDLPKTFLEYYDVTPK